MTSSKGIKFGTLVLVLEVVFIVLMGIFAEYRKVGVDNIHGNETEAPPETGAALTNAPYYNFQDVNVMVFIGLGFLITFLKQYAYSGVSLNLLIGGVSVQWAFIIRGFLHVDIIGGATFTLGISEMTTALFASATVLISYCVLLGKVSPTQLVVMAMLEIPIAQCNEYIGLELLHTADIGESIYLHMFAAYFGLAVARVLYDPDVKDNDKEGAVYYSDMFAMVGSVFLWIYWPSFNGGFSTYFTERATLNTFLSLCASTVVTFAVSGMLDKHGRFDMVHIQNAVLAGGVVVGSTADMPMQPFGAMVFGSAGALVCVLGYKFLTPFLASKLNIHDTCGVHNLHGMPAIVAAIGSAVLAASSGSWDKWEQQEIFSKIGDDRSPMEQGGYQMLATAMTLGFAIVGGVIVGFIMKLPIWNAPTGDSIFHDVDNFELPDEGMPGSKPVANGLNGHDSSHKYNVAVVNDKDDQTTM